MSVKRKVVAKRKPAPKRRPLKIGDKVTRNDDRSFCVLGRVKSVGRGKALVHWAPPDGAIERVPTSSLERVDPGSIGPKAASVPSEFSKAAKNLAAELREAERITIANKDAAEAAQRAAVTVAGIIHELSSMGRLAKSLAHLTRAMVPERNAKARFFELSQALQKLQSISRDVCDWRNDAASADIRRAMKLLETVIPPPPRCETCGCVKP